jgi:uncharacterized coiled-coil protein SlyX
VGRLLPDSFLPLCSDLRSQNEEQQRQIDALTAQVKEQAAQVQKVSAQLELIKPASQMLADNQ